MLDDNEHYEEQDFLNDELQPADEPGWEQRKQHKRDPEEVLRLIVADPAQRDPNEPDASAHSTEEATPGGRG